MSEQREPYTDPQDDEHARQDDLVHMRHYRVLEQERDALRARVESLTADLARAVERAEAAEARCAEIGEAAIALLGFLHHGWCDSMANLNPTYLDGPIQDCHAGCGGA